MTEHAKPTTEMRNSLPLWLAVSITVVLMLPFGLWLGTWNFVLWCAFIVWAEYFALGARPQVLRILIPAYTFGTVVTGIAMFVNIYLTQWLPSVHTPGDLAIAIDLFVFVAIMVYAMGKSKTLATGSLAMFNGISMVLALYFSGSFPHVGGAAAAPWMALLWAIVSGWFGALAGAFNVWILFPRPVRAVSADGIPTR